jgi:hypothetical protein
MAGKRISSGKFESRNISLGESIFSLYFCGTKEMVPGE